jgi:8-oxo-dGTP pyrophosphatase MutT (NUDIX family)
MDTKPKSRHGFSSKHPEIRTKKSYGVAICRFNLDANQYEMLLVKKRCTYNFVEFVLGHYAKTNESRLIYLFNGMTNAEKLSILSLDYGNIYYNVFLTNPDSLYFDDSTTIPDNLVKFKLYKRKFIDTFVRDDGVRLRLLIAKSKNIETIWEVPKGRKSNPQEKELSCAVRETVEETGVSLAKYKLLLDISPRRMTHTDMNTKYINYLYIGLIGNPKFIPRVSFGDKQQLSEVVNVAWMNLEQIKNIDNNNLHNFAKIVFKLLKKKEKVGKLARLHLNGPN